VLHRREPDLPDFDAPVLVAALDGWVDAAGAASAAAVHLAGEGGLVARFIGDELFDYRSRRPVLDLVDGALTRLDWPELAVRHVRAGDRDLLVLYGAEPDLRWEALAEDVVSLARSLGVSEWVSLGAIPAAVPHTRPVPIMATASDDGLLRNGENRGPQGILRVPAAALSVLEMAASAAGIPAVGFFAQVPPYAGGGYTAASVALLEHLGRHVGVTLDVAELRALAEVEARRMDAAAASDPETHRIVAQLEAVGEDLNRPLPTGEEIASEVERFLAGLGGDDPEDPEG
jgi:hypothetical protein